MNCSKEKQSTIEITMLKCYLWLTITQTTTYPVKNGPQSHSQRLQNFNLPLLESIKHPLGYRLIDIVYCHSLVDVFLNTFNIGISVQCKFNEETILCQFPKSVKYISRLRLHKSRTYPISVIPAGGSLTTSDVSSK